MGKLCSHKRRAKSDDREIITQIVIADDNKGSGILKNLLSFENTTEQKCILKIGSVTCLQKVMTSY
jgi:hypothetical protein